LREPPEPAPVKATLTDLTKRDLTVIPLEDVVANLSRSLNDWVNDFHYRTSVWPWTRSGNTPKAVCTRTR
jgi:hypothetical protein